MAFEQHLRTHPTYDKMEPEWRFYIESALGGKDYIGNHSNLFSHRLENSADDYQARKDRAYYLNYCNLVCRIYSNYIFKETVHRPIDPTLNDFYKNVDGRGTDIDTFMADACFLSAVYGRVHIVVDSPNINPATMPLHQLKARHGLPYATIISPLQLRDWSVDKYGLYNWILIHHAGYDDSDPFLPRVDNDTFTFITRQYWEKYNSKGALLDGGENPLGEVYMTTLHNFTHSGSVQNESLISDISRINRAIYNYCSNIDEMIERQTFSQLVVPGDAQEELDAEGEGIDLRKIGMSTLFTFPADSGQPPQFISPNTDNLSVIYATIEKLISHIYDVAGLSILGTQTKFKSQTSGIAQAYRFTRLNVSLAKKSQRLEKCERDMLRLLGRWYGKNLDNGVLYPQGFDVYSVHETMHTTFNIVAQNISATLNIELLKHLAKKSAPLLSDRDMALIYEEIKKNKGQIRLPLNDEGKENATETRTEGNE